MKDDQSLIRITNNNDNDPIFKNQNDTYNIRIIKKIESKNYQSKNELHKKINIFYIIIIILIIIIIFLIFNIFKLYNLIKLNIAKNIQLNNALTFPNIEQKIQLINKTNVTQYKMNNSNINISNDTNTLNNSNIKFSNEANAIDDKNTNISYDNNPISYLNSNISNYTNNNNNISTDLDIIISNTNMKKLDYKNINNDEMNDYIRLCNNGNLISKIPKFVDNPKITVVIPVYNAHKYLKKTIRSIQNQNMEEIEILIVDDFSTDNTIEVVKELQEEDCRIKLIKNKENRGTLYTRSIGALNAKGKYIMPIDNDDLFMPGIFNISYEEAENNNIDIIEFSGCDKSIGSLFKKKECYICLFLRYKAHGVIIKQPELSTFIYQKKKGRKNKYQIIDAYLWGKCIKSSIYKKALEILGEDTYTENICYCEDRIVNFGLFRIANSFKFINRYGIVHNNNPSSVGYTWKKKKQFHDELLNVLSIYNLTKNSSDSKLAAIQFEIMWDWSSKGLSFENKELAKYVYYTILNETYISQFRKKKLTKLVGKALS